MEKQWAVVSILKGGYFSEIMHLTTVCHEYIRTQAIPINSWVIVKGVDVMSQPLLESKATVHVWCSYCLCSLGRSGRIAIFCAELGGSSMLQS